MDIENVTNEELATAIKEGNTEIMPLLWKKNECLIKLIIFKHLRGRKLPNSIDEEDILQCGYFALIAAVKAFKQGEYKFTTYLNYSVQNAVNEAINGKSRLSSNIKELSYNKYIQNKDGNDIELWELMRDDTAEFEIFEGVELSDEQQIVCEALAELPTKERNIIRCHYFRNMSLRQIAEMEGCTIENIRQHENKAFRQLRKNKKLISLNEGFIRHNIYQSVSRFKGSPEYFYNVRYAERLIREQERQGKYLSYGQRQAEIFLLLYKAEQEYKEI